MEDSSSDDSRAAYRVKKSRAKKGQCPHCGIQCYQKRWFGTMKPITRLPDVENGRCLICSQITDSSGTEGDDRETDNGNDSIVRAGEVMRLFTDMITDEDTRYDEYVGTWPGEIQRGSHVQCIGNSLNSPDSVQIGDVGIAASRDLDGTYRVNFPAKDDWCCRPSDLMLDSDAEKIRRGALVRVKSSVIEPQFGWGNLTGLHDTVGFVKRVRYDGIVSVQFGWRNDDDGSVELWMAPMKELEFVDPATQRSDWNGSIQLGDAVRIPSSVDEPSMGWGNLTQGDVGYARAITVKRGRLMYVCDFPSADAWFGTDKDLEKDPHASLIRPGVRVRVKPGIEPKKGWGEVTSSSVGTVVSIDYDGNPVIINFPEQRRWRCFLSEIELFDNAAEGETNVIEIPQAVPLMTTTNYPTSTSVVTPARVAHFFDVGDKAILSDLTSVQDMNGSEVIVVAKCSLDRFRVKLTTDSERVYTVKLSNLIPVSIDEEMDVQVGDVAVLKDFDSAEDLNGSEAIVLEKCSDGHLRVKVFDSGNEYIVMPHNLMLVVLE